MKKKKEKARGSWKKKPIIPKHTHTFKQSLLFSGRVNGKLSFSFAVPFQSQGFKADVQSASFN